MKVIAVTGASAGVGRAAVRRFARSGARLGLIARGRERLESTAGRGRGARRRGARAPGRRRRPRRGRERRRRRSRTRLGPLDVWVNNAMATVFAPVGDTTPEEFRRATEVTYLGSVWGTMAALRRMRPRDRGHDRAGRLGARVPLASRSRPPYCGAKHAIRGFTESLRTELLHDGSNVHVTMVQLPGAQHAAVRLEPREAAAAAAAGAADLPARGRGRGDRTTRRRTRGASSSVGWPTVKAIYGEQSRPGSLDRYPRPRRLRRAADRRAARRPSGPATSSSPSPATSVRARAASTSEAKPRSLALRRTTCAAGRWRSPRLGALAAAILITNGKD